MYVAFMGTKRREDIITNSAVYQELLWKEQRFRLQVLTGLCNHVVNPER